MARAELVHVQIQQKAWGVKRKGACLYTPQRHHGLVDILGEQFTLARYSGR